MIFLAVLDLLAILDLLVELDLLGVLVRGKGTEQSAGPGSSFLPLLLRAGGERIRADKVLLDPAGEFAVEAYYLDPFALYVEWVETCLSVHY